MSIRQDVKYLYFRLFKDEHTLQQKIKSLGFLTHFQECINTVGDEKHRIDL